MLTYQDSGVDPLKNDQLVEQIKNATNISTGFADVQPIEGTDVLIAQCSDGVGTKIQLAAQYPELYQTIGQDLVAMCVNDLICIGAKPAYFQDYIGMNNLNESIVLSVVHSITQACEQCGVKLTGGEMAEMPGTYIHDIPELVGFATGFCTTETQMQTSGISPGNVIIGLPSSGPHSNGYSLIRKVVNNNQIPDDVMWRILEPTRLYCKVSDVYQTLPNAITGIAHITGGGLESNLQRIIPRGLKAVINYNSWKVPLVFEAIQQLGNVDVDSMWNTFNMGVGMCVVVKHEQYVTVYEQLKELSPFVLGSIE